MSCLDSMLWSDWIGQYMHSSYEDLSSSVHNSSSGRGSSFVDLDVSFLFDYAWHSSRACSSSAALAASSASLEQGISSKSGPSHSFPLQKEGIKTVLVLSFCAPHPEGQFCHSPHSLQTQSTGQQTSSLQISVSKLSPWHSVPLLIASFLTGLSLTVVPASQVVVQVVHSPHSSHTHGHGWVSILCPISSISWLFWRAYPSHP